MSNKNKQSTTLSTKSGTDDKSTQTPRQPRQPKPAAASSSAATPLSPVAIKARSSTDINYSLSQIALGCSGLFLFLWMGVCYWFATPSIFSLHIRAIELGETHPPSPDTMSARIAEDFTRFFAAIALSLGFLTIAGRRASLSYSRLVFDAFVLSFLLFGLLMLGQHQANGRWSSLIIFFDCIGAIAVVLFATEYSQIYATIDAAFGGALSGGNKRSGRRAEAKVRQDKLWRSRMLLICGAVLLVYGVAAMAYPRFVAVETLHVQIRVGETTASPTVTIAEGNSAATPEAAAAAAAAAAAGAGAAASSNAKTAKAETDAAGTPAASANAASNTPGSASTVVQPPPIMAVGVDENEVEQSLGEWLSDPNTWQFQPYHVPDVAQRVATFLFGMVYLAVTIFFVKDHLDAPRGLRALHITFTILHALFAFILSGILCCHSSQAGEWLSGPITLYLLANLGLLGLHVLPLQTLSSSTVATSDSIGTHRPLLDFTWT